MEKENILGVYPIEVTKGGLIRCYNAFLTDRRILALYLESRTWTKYYGGCVTIGYRLIDSLITIPLTKNRGIKPSDNPESILNSHKNNFAWYFKDIKTAEFRKSRGSWGQNLIDVEFTNGNKELVSYDTKHGKELSSILLELLPGKIIVTSV